MAFWNQNKKNVNCFETIYEQACFYYKLRQGEQIITCIMVIETVGWSTSWPVGLPCLPARIN
mgnify:CR=1 FL=1